MIERILIDKSNYNVFLKIIELVKVRKIDHFRMSRKYNAYNIEYNECEYNDKPEVEDLLEILETLDIADKSVQKFYIFYDIDNDGIIYNVEKKIVKEKAEEELSESEKFAKAYKDFKTGLMILGIDKVNIKLPKSKKETPISLNVIFDNIELEINKRI
jgi:hypothetical protein